MSGVGNAIINNYCDEQFIKLAEMAKGFVGTDFVVPTDEDELFYKLKEVAYRIAVEFFNGKEPEEKIVTPFFVICDELGLGEDFKHRIFENE